MDDVTERAAIALIIAVTEDMNAEELQNVSDYCLALRDCRLMAPETQEQISLETINNAIRNNKKWNQLYNLGLKI